MQDISYINRCIHLAANGLGNVAPNPMVGCVIVHEGKIIGEGFHRAFGEAHAEVSAINSVKDQSLLPASTLYVNLEPCAHYGKTPPCVDLILEKKIARVVVANMDPNPLVSGKGFQKLRDQGVDLKIGICQAEGTHLNRRFFTYHTKQRPYIILKWAQSSDGFLDMPRDNSETGIRWISSPATGPLVHLWRSQEQAILVGKKTVLNDNPALTVRHVAGHNPLRIAIDRQLEIPVDAKIFSGGAKTLVINEIRDQKRDGVQWLKLDFSSNLLQQLLTWLHANQIQSLLVEGGAFTLTEFVSQNFWDEARVLTADVYFGCGLKAPVLPVVPVSTSRIGNDHLAEFNNLHV